MATGSQPLRWGILGAGEISESFCRVLQTPDLAQDHKIVAVGARQLSSAQAFADKLQIPSAYGSYDEVGQNAEVDVVYIGTIHPPHAQLSIMCLKAGKHVLCEKPMALNQRQVREVLAVAKEKKLFFMEGFWSRFFPVYDKLREVMRDGTIGEIRFIDVNFGLNFCQKARIAKKELGGGALLDVGCYSTQMCELIFGGNPDKIVATGNLLETGVDDSTCITLLYPGNKMAVLKASASNNLNQMAFIYGTKGTIKIPYIWCPTTIVINDESHHFPLSDTGPDFILLRDRGFAYQIRSVRELIRNGALESPLITHESSLSIMKILDEARRQVGVEFPADKEGL